MHQKEGPLSPVQRIAPRSLEPFWEAHSLQCGLQSQPVNLCWSRGFVQKRKKTFFAQAAVDTGNKVPEPSSSFLSRIFRPTAQAAADTASGAEPPAPPGIVMV